MIREFSETRVGSVCAGSEILVGVWELKVDRVNELKVAVDFKRYHFEFFRWEVPALFRADFFFLKQAFEELIH